jgi:hypothetical protein
MPQYLYARLGSAMNRARARPSPTETRNGTRQSKGCRFAVGSFELNPD